MKLLMKNISHTFGSTKALDCVDFQVGESEIHGLMGENGAGKSTLMNILAGTFPPAAGKIIIDEKEIENMTTRRANELGIRFIHQELNMVNDLMIYENLFLGSEIKTKFGFLDKRAMIEKSQNIFKRMKLELNPEKLVGELDTSRKQLVEIAKALLFESKLIIMDEPTTALTNREIENLFTIMRNLKEQGVSIIYISHKMPELFEICDRYTVLRDGRFIETGEFTSIDERKATELLVGRSIVQEEMKQRENHGAVVFKVENLSCENGFQDVSFKVRKGEVLAVTGLYGDGRGELAEALFGARKITGGKVYINDKSLNLKNIKKVIKQGVGMVPRNRKERSIIKDMSILDNLSMVHFIKDHRDVFIKKPQEIERFNRNQKIIKIKISKPEDYITSLSGGNQQKVVVGRWLESNSEVYILDNPTQGIDIGAKFEIYKIIDRLAEEGKSIVVFSSEFSEIHRIAQRCLVMYRGRINADLTRDELTEMKVMYYATGSNKGVLK